MGVVKELMRSKSPAEVVALLRYANKAKSARAHLTASLSAHWRYAYEALCNVSRSFALVIMQLDRDLRDPVCVFYLVLRALDTVEDDTSVDATLRQSICKQFWTFLPKPCITSEDGNDIVSLSAFCPTPSTSAPTPKTKKALDDLPSNESVFPLSDDCEGDNREDSNPWHSSAFGKGAEKELCERFPEVIQCYNELPPQYQAIIRDITRRMGYGMASHINDVSCDTVDEYDLYCHYAAGLVGYGLTDLFVASGREAGALGTESGISNSMGLFLQKTNIIRDYLEDIEEGRTFWPGEIWTNYASTLDELKNANNRKFALAALNHMVTDALHHVPECLQYMTMVNSPDVFNFVAIPQVMAIATLNEVYNNGAVFEGVVKLRRSKTAHLVLQTTDMKAVYAIFFKTARAMLLKIPPHDPNATATKNNLSRIVELCLPHVPTAPNLIIPNVVSIVLFCILSSYVLKRRQDHFDGAVFTWRSAGGIMEPLDMLAVGALFLVCMYMFGFFLLPYMSQLQQDDWHRLQRVDHHPSRLSYPIPSRRVVELNEDGTSCEQNEPRSSHNVISSMN